MMDKKSLDEMFKSFKLRRRVLELPEDKQLKFYPIDACWNHIPSQSQLANMLVASLINQRLPLALIDHFSTKELIAESLNLPIVIFANSYIGTEALRSSEMSQDSMYFRYSELLAALILCYKLEGLEAIWIDNYLSPLSKNTAEINDELCGKRNRLVILNLIHFPPWASNLQYSEACILGDIMKATAGFYLVDLSDEDLNNPWHVKPFSQEWWINHAADPEYLNVLAKPKYNSPSVPRDQEACINHSSIKAPQHSQLAWTSKAKTINQFAGYLLSTAINNALREAGNRMQRIPLIIPDGSPESSNLAAFETNLLDCSRTSQQGFSRNTSRMGTDTPSKTVFFAPILREEPLSHPAILNQSSGNVKKCLDGTASLLTSQILVEVSRTVASRFGRLNRFATTLVNSVLRRSILQLTTPHKHGDWRRPPFIDTQFPVPLLKVFSRFSQPIVPPSTDALIRAPCTPLADSRRLKSDGCALTPLRNPPMFSYKHQLILFSSSLVARSILGAMITLRSAYFRQGHADFSHQKQNVSIKDTGFSEGTCSPFVGGVPRTEPRRRSAGLVTHSPEVAGRDAQMNVTLQWIAAAIASAGNTVPTAASPPEARKPPPSYVSPIIFVTNANPHLKQFDHVVRLIQSAGWTAGDLLQSLLNYCDYRTQLSSDTQSTSCSVKIISFFDYLIGQISADLKILSS